MRAGFGCMRRASWREWAGRAAALIALVCLCPDSLFAQGGQGAPSAPPPIRRWLDVQAATLNLRYRVIENSAGTVTTNQLQHRETLRARVIFDAAKRYTLNVGLFTGNAFTGSWDPTGAGTGEPSATIFLKQLYQSRRYW